MPPKRRRSNISKQKGAPPPQVISKRTRSSVPNIPDETLNKNTMPPKKSKNMNTPDVTVADTQVEDQIGLGSLGLISRPRLPKWPAIIINSEIASEQAKEKYNVNRSPDKLMAFVLHNDTSFVVTSKKAFEFWPMGKDNTKRLKQLKKGETASGTVIKKRSLTQGLAKAIQEGKELSLLSNDERLMYVERVAPKRFDNTHTRAPDNQTLQSKQNIAPTSTIPAVKQTVVNQNQAANTYEHNRGITEICTSTANVASTAPIQAAIQAVTTTSPVITGSSTSQAVSRIFSPSLNADSTTSQPVSHTSSPISSQISPHTPSQTAQAISDAIGIQHSQNSDQTQSTTTTTSYNNSAVKPNSSVSSSDSSWSSQATASSMCHPDSFSTMKEYAVHLASHADRLSNLLAQSKTTTSQVSSVESSIQSLCERCTEIVVSLDILRHSKLVAKLQRLKSLCDNPDLKQRLGTQLKRWKKDLQNTTQKATANSLKHNVSAPLQTVTTTQTVATTPSQTVATTQTVTTTQSAASSDCIKNVNADTSKKSDNQEISHTSPQSVEVIPENTTISTNTTTHVSDVPWSGIECPYRRSGIWLLYRALVDIACGVNVGALVDDMDAETGKAQGEQEADGIAVADISPLILNVLARHLECRIANFASQLQDNLKNQQLDSDMGIKDTKIQDTFEFIRKNGMDIQSITWSRKKMLHVPQDASFLHVSDVGSLGNDDPGCISKYFTHISCLLARLAQQLQTNVVAQATTIPRTDCFVQWLHQYNRTQIHNNPLEDPRFRLLQQLQDMRGCDAIVRASLPTEEMFVYPVTD